MTRKKDFKTVGKMLGRVLEEIYQGRDIPQEALDAFSRGDIKDGVSELSALVQNPFDREPSDLAKRLVGQPITYANKNEVVGGIVYHAAPYQDPLEEWETLEAPGTDPGLVGVWHSPRRGGYDVAIITSRQTEEERFNYVALWSAKVGGERLRLADTAAAFRFADLAGTSLAGQDEQLIITPYEGKGLKRLGGLYKVKRQRERSKGAGCKESYKLVEI